MLANLNEQPDIVKKFFPKNRFVFGLVMVASGLKEKPMKTAITREPTALLSIIDWALIKPQNRSVGTSNISQISQIVAILVFVTLTSQVPAHRSLGVSKLADFSLCSIQNEKQLFKVGCATGFTGRIYNGLKTVHVATPLVDSREVKIQTWEHNFCKSLSQSVVEERDFGSLVIDLLGAVAGVRFGRTYCGDIGYFTHTADLIENIQEVTGVKEIRLKEERTCYPRPCCTSGCILLQNIAIINIVYYYAVVQLRVF